MATTMREYRSTPSHKTLTDKVAQIVGPELTRLAEESAERSGEPLSPHTVVEAARSSHSRLHRFFTWDDEQAADNWRVTQARKLMQAVEVRIESGAWVPAYYSIRVRVTQPAPRPDPQILLINRTASPPLGEAERTEPDDEPEETVRGYVTAEQVENNAEYMLQVITQARRELRHWARRHRQYQDWAMFEVAGLPGVLEKIEQMPLLPGEESPGTE